MIPGMRPGVGSCGYCGLILDEIEAWYDAWDARWHDVRMQPNDEP